MIGKINKKQYVKILWTLLVVIIGIYSLFQDKEYGFVLDHYIAFSILSLVNLILIWIPNIFNELANRWIVRILFVLTPLFDFYFVERFNNIYIWDIKGLGFYLNLIIISLVLLLFYFISNRLQIAMILTTILLSFFSLLNFFIFSFRGSPILAGDVLSIKTAVNVSANYSIKLNSDVTINILGIVLFLIVVCKLHNKSRLEIKMRFMGITVYLVLLGVLGFNFYETDKIGDAGLDVNPWYPQWSYQANGLLISFLITSKDYKIDKPVGYSLKAVDDIMEPYMAESSDSSNKSKVNVIAIMNETFSDLKQVGNFDTSEDYMPFIRNLEEDTVKGTLYVSVFGGNTANSEFEFLTGNTLAFLPSRCVPYQLYIKDKFASLTDILKVQGYIGNKAIHPYYSDGWKRDKNYPLLGFDDFIAIDDFDSPNMIRNLISDEESFNKIIEEYESERLDSDSPFYSFNVTIQNHGPYDLDYDNLDRDIKILGEYADDEAERYINLIKKTDEAFEKLVEYFSNINEPTVVVMFGDHQPAIHNEFYNKIMGEDVDGLTAEEAMLRYQVPFIIWANYDIQEKKYEKLSANYLSALLLDTIGAQKTGYMKFLSELSEQVPVITANGYYDAEGDFYLFDDNSPYVYLINKYKILQYNNMFDKKNRRDTFFILETNNN